MPYSYILTENFAYDEENKRHIAYGIAAVDKSGKVIQSFSDVFFDKTKAEHLVSLCNKGNLSIIHFNDVIEDALT